jgi:hypothetical protein
LNPDPFNHFFGSKGFKYFALYSTNTSFNWHCGMSAELQWVTRSTKMKRLALSAVPLLAAYGYALAADTLPAWPTDAADESDARVVAFYQAQCNQWATQAGRQGEDKQNYAKWCNQQMPNLAPVGFEADKGEE